MGLESEFVPENALISPEVRKTLDSYLALEGNFAEPPQVKLGLISSDPNGQPISAHDVAASVSFQCYQPGVARIQPRTSEAAKRVNKMTLDGGHHTTRQHTHYTWHLVGLTRSTIHDVFHSHPYYNSEQQSQRYAEVKMDSYLIPQNVEPDQQEVYVETARSMNEAYFQLLTMIRPFVEDRIKAMYPEQRSVVERTQKRLADKATKIAQEIARYVLPIGQKSTMHHTLSELQLLRMFRASKLQHFSDESRYILARMIQEVAAHDPSLYGELSAPIDPPQRALLSEAERAAYASEFDAMMGDKQSRLVDISQDPRGTLAQAVRNIEYAPASLMNDTEALNALLNPAANRMFADVYDTGIQDPLTSASRQVALTFATKLSHTGDSQRQRHRMTPGATPPIDVLYTGQPDYVVPMIVRETPELAEMYERVMAETYAKVEKALEMGMPREQALLLLPNAHTVRVIETGDMYDWVHRLRQRLCYLAQEEIFFASVEQAQELTSVFPEGEKLFLAPCGIRQAAGVKPKCPEGDRWCGKPVYHWGLDKYTEGRLV